MEGRNDMCINIMSLIPGVSVPLKSIIHRLVTNFKQQIFAVKKNRKLTMRVLTAKTLEDIGGGFKILYTKIFNNVTRGHR
jgi:hypothetical protein